MDVSATATSKGQVTLPKAVRDALGIREGDELLFRVHKNRAVLAKLPDFLDLKCAGAARKKGASWSKIKAETWRKRTAKRH